MVSLRRPAARIKLGLQSRAGQAEAGRSWAAAHRIDTSSERRLGAVIPYTRLPGLSFVCP